MQGIRSAISSVSTTGIALSSANKALGGTDPSLRKADEGLDKALGLLESSGRSLYSFIQKT